MSIETASAGTRLLVLAGPHGVGKDAILAGLLERAPWYVRLVRLTTRAPSPREVDGVDYRFVSPTEFDREREAGYLMAVGTYPEASTGIRQRELLALGPGLLGLVSMNMIDALLFQQQCEALGVHSVVAFVSPVDRCTLESSEQVYLDVLRDRISSRGRSTDDVRARLLVAKRYRNAFLAEPRRFDYIVNGEGNLDSAIAQSHAAAATLRSRIGGP